jgi:iron complex transport system substrate-binding protein
MKTKNKTLALVEIAVVLCSVFLVATLPAIAADTQKASATEVTTASEDDYVLGIYGNANEDDTIDMGDVVYTKLAIFGKKPKTELCDAKYDRRINVLDVIQTKLIILGKEKEITIVDSVDRIVTVKKPIKRIIVINSGSGEMIQVLNAVDKVVGGSDSIAGHEIDLPELSKLPSVGFFTEPDCEVILSLNPDIILTYQHGGGLEKLENKLPDSIKVIALDFYNSEKIKKLGYILDKEEEAEEFIDWYESYVDNIKSRTEGLLDDERPKIYYGRYFRGTIYATYTKHSYVLGDLIEIAGGRNIAADLGTEYGMGVVNVDPEWVIKQNPDIIVISVWSGGGYNTDDPSEMIEGRDMVMNRPELASVTAVKKGRVYVINIDIWASPSNEFVSPSYYAKWFHPELFEDLSPRAVLQEYIDFRHLDYDLDKHGVFVYHPERHPDGK